MVQMMLFSSVFVQTVMGHEMSSRSRNLVLGFGVSYCVGRNGIGIILVVSSRTGMHMLRYRNVIHRKGEF